MKTLLCHGCGIQFRHEQGADLYCTPACGELHKAQREGLKEQIKQAGFSPVPGILNLFEKAGVHITLEQVIREGLGTTVAKHREAVAQRF